MDDENAQLDTTVLEQIIAATPEQADRLLRAAAEGITNDVKLEFNTSPPDHTYTRGSIQHTASLPGYPPNVDTGALRASIHWEPAGNRQYIVADGVQKGYWLEEGTDKMQPRPFMQPVFKNWSQSKFIDLATSFGLIPGA